MLKGLFVESHLLVNNKQLVFRYQKAANSLTLDIGEDRIVLATRAHVYHLDIYLPFNLIQEDCGAQFDRKSRVCVSDYMQHIMMISS